MTQPVPGCLALLAIRPLLPVGATEGLSSSAGGYCVAALEVRPPAPAPGRVRAAGALDLSAASYGRKRPVSSRGTRRSPGAGSGGFSTASAGVLAAAAAAVM